MTKLRHLRIACAIALAACVVLGSGASVRADTGAANGANSVRMVVSPRTINNLTGEVQVHVTGSGFSTTENGAVGIYLSYGEQPTGDRIGNRAFTDVTVAYDGGSGHGTKWVRPQTPAGPNQARLEADGTFSVDLSVRATFTAPNGGAHSYKNETLGIYGYAAHGTEAQASGFSQRVFVALRFQAPATPKPTVKPTPRPTARPTSAPTPAPTSKPTAAPTVQPSQAVVSSPPGQPSSEPSPTATAVPVAAASSSPLAPSGGPGSSASPAPTAVAVPFDGDAASANGVGIGPAIPLVLGLLVLVFAGVRWMFTRKSGQRA